MNSTQSISEYAEKRKQAIEKAKRLREDKQRNNLRDESAIKERALKQKQMREAYLNFTSEEENNAVSNKQHCETPSKKSTPLKPPIPRQGILSPSPNSRAKSLAPLLEEISTLKQSNMSLTTRLEGFEKEFIKTNRIVEVLQTTIDSLKDDILTINSRYSIRIAKLETDIEKLSATETIAVLKNDHRVEEELKDMSMEEYHSATVASPVKQPRKKLSLPVCSPTKEGEPLILDNMLVPETGVFDTTEVDEKNEVIPEMTGYDLDSAMAGDSYAVAEDTELKPCKDCGRNFNLDALARHKKICKKVFMKKRKPFKVTLMEDENGRAITASCGTSSGTTSSKSSNKRKASPKKPTAKKADWRKQSNSLREAMRAAREYAREEQGLQ